MPKEPDRHENINRHDDNQPVYRQVAYALEDIILNDLEMGDFLPSENELSLRFGVNRHTVRVKCWPLYS